jgi:hypothetical protein
VNSIVIAPSHSTVSQAGFEGQKAMDLSLSQVRAALEAEVHNVPDISVMAWETGLSMEWVTDLCSAPLFYHRSA